jgi:P4 family phage/plasmid primase-like protien
MRQDYFEYVPQFKLVISGNHRPAIRNVDKAMRRRFNLIPFSVQISDGEKDLKLPEKLKAEYPGILQWMIEGCLEWQRVGLAAPKVVTDATDQYMQNENTIANWVEENCELGPNAECPRTVLYANFCKWAEEANEYTPKAREFYKRLADEYGCGETKDTGVRKMTGIKLNKIQEDAMNFMNFNTAGPQRTYGSHRGGPST